MKTKAVVIAVLVIAAAILATGAFVMYQKNAVAPTLTSTSTQSAIPAGWSTYTSSKYGFEISYPSPLAPTTTFASYYHLPNAWRVGAMPNSSGRAVISIPVYRLNNRLDYPRYFDAEIRIGASSNPTDVKNCYSTYGYGSPTPPTDETINGIKFRAFPLESAGMMQYLMGVSYRTVHNGVCYAIEQLKAGSNYRNPTSSPQDIPQSVLDNYYNQASAIVQTFRFTK